MLISNLINDSFGLLSKQLRFYCWHYKRDLDQRQQQELLEILNEQYFERLASKIKSLIASDIADCRQQIGKLLFEQCLASHRRHQLIQLIESDLVDIDVRLDNYGRTLLHRTAYNLDVELVKLLIDHGVNIYLRDYAGSTALHIAIQSYRNGGLIYNNEPEVVQNLTQIIRLLLDTDHNLQKKNQFGNKKLRLETSDKSGHDIRPSNLEERGQASNGSMETSLRTSIEQEYLVANESHKANRDQTICRLIGSQCMCKTDNYGHNQKQHKSVNEASEAGDRELSNKKAAIDMRHASSHDQARQVCSSCPIDLAKSEPVPLVNSRNAFGRTPLHYCVLVVGELYLDQIIKLLLSYGADPDIVDSRMKTPLYHLVKRPSTSAIRKKCLAIRHLVESGCDDLGLAITPKKYFDERMLGNLEANAASLVQKQADEKIERIFTQTTFRRVPSLKHLTRLCLVRSNNGKLGHQIGIALPNAVPRSLNLYINRKLLDQSELF